MLVDGQNDLENVPESRITSGCLRILHETPHVSETVSLMVVGCSESRTGVGNVIHGNQRHPCPTLPENPIHLN